MNNMIGDLNFDGKIDRNDLNILQQILASAGYDDETLLSQLDPDQLMALDINQDGQLDKDDIEKLLQLILKGNAQNSKALTEKFLALRQKSQ